MVQFSADFDYDKSDYSDSEFSDDNSIPEFKSFVTINNGTSTPIKSSNKISFKQPEPRRLFTDVHDENTKGRSGALKFSYPQDTSINSIISAENQITTNNNVPGQVSPDEVMELELGLQNMDMGPSIDKIMNPKALGGRAVDFIKESNQQQTEIVNDLCEEFHDRIFEDVDKESEALNSNFETLKDGYGAIIDHVMDSISERSHKRDDEIGKLVGKLQQIRHAKLEKEKERIRLEEERKRREEEERRRKEEERRRKEEERKRKEEEERKRALEEAKKKALEEEKKRKEEELRRKQEQEKKSQEQKAKRAEELKKKEEAAKSGAAFTDQTNIETELMKYRQVCLDYRENIKNKMKLAELKDLRTKCTKIRRKLNPRFGQLTNSVSKLNSITADIFQVLDEARTVGSPNPNDEINRFAFKWIMYIISKLIIRQAESEISVSMKSGIPLARLVVYLTVKYPELQEILFAKFAKKCPFIIGYSCSSETVEGRIRMGWKYESKEDKKWETDLKYCERLGGMLVVWSMMSTVKFSDNEQIVRVLGLNAIVPPINISQSWLMVSRLLNSERSFVTNATFYMFCTWVEAAGNEFSQAYGKQGQKLLTVLCCDFPQSFTGEKFTSASKLITLGEEWKNSGKFGKLEPMEP
ncbi:nucleoporin [Saccharomycopsis crataegensis]|uniref:mRNA export factor GLE1 n=1 Tax=Saccharomycopsis crataegensis TaxID=43959 RepID=A0AAV5QHL7_9ASCO|nr:nucleoporin [Saccharomycopsis crataegensis]